MPEIAKKPPVVIDHGLPDKPATGFAVRHPGRHDRVPMLGDPAFNHDKEGQAARASLLINLWEVVMHDGNVSLRVCVTDPTRNRFQPSPVLLRCTVENCL